ncbi:MAG TPA: S8 family serine peptidase [Gemmatimonadaceae bacterium]|nr:S8 family serine peptidase [Gemmatimonadaceae bacterium]
MRTKLVVLGVFAVLAGCSDQVAPTAVTAPSTQTAPSGAALDALAAEGASTPADHFIMGFTAATPPQDVYRIVAQAGGSYTPIAGTGFGVVRGISDADADSLRTVTGVTGVARDVVLTWVPGTEAVRATAGDVTVATDQSGAAFFLPFQWYLRQINADDAWLTTNQGAGARVAILDTGIDPGHLDLNGRVDLTSSASMLTPGSSPCGSVDETTIFDLNFHGTFVSALVTSNGIGMGSVAPDAQLVAFKVLNCSGRGSFLDVINGIIAATNAGANVINMSLGAIVSRRSSGPLIDALQAAVDFATAHGVTVVAAAGNDAIDFDHLPKDLADAKIMDIPGMLKNVLSVGATAPVNQQNFDQLATYTNFGKQGTDVMAPGGDLVAGGVQQDLIISACSRFVCGVSPTGGNFYVLASGTSFSSPLTAGAAAVALSQGQEPAHCIIKGADRITGRGNDPLYSRGRVDVVGAATCSVHDVVSDE